MLVLTRKRNERIMIGDDIVITVAEIKYDKIRIGIEAPSNIPIHREEVYKKIKEVKKAKVSKPYTVEFKLPE